MTHFSRSTRYVLLAKVSNATVPTFEASYALGTFELSLRAMVTLVAIEIFGAGKRLNAL
jgi:hypothetical protein